MAEGWVNGAPQYKNGPEYLPDFIQLGIGQQLRRIADAMPHPIPTLETLGERMDAYSPEAKAYASVALRRGVDVDPWDIEDVWDVVAAAYDVGHVNAEHEAAR